MATSETELHRALRNHARHSYGRPNCLRSPTSFSSFFFLAKKKDIVPRGKKRVDSRQRTSGYVNVDESGRKFVMLQGRSQNAPTGERGTVGNGQKEKKAFKFYKIHTFCLHYPCECAIILYILFLRRNISGRNHDGNGCRQRFLCR